MTPELKSDITGCILAGGQGIRIGGKDKGLITLNGRYLSQHCIETSVSAGRFYDHKRQQEHTCLRKLWMHCGTR